MERQQVLQRIGLVNLFPTNNQQDYQILTQRTKELAALLLQEKARLKITYPIGNKKVVQATHLAKSNQFSRAETLWSLRLNDEQDKEIIDQLSQLYQDEIERSKVILKRLEYSEKKRQLELIAKQEVLRTKMEVEILLVIEKQKLQAFLEGKASVYLKQRIEDLELQVKELNKSIKDQKAVNRSFQKKIDILNQTLESKKKKFKDRLDQQRQFHQAKQDKFKLLQTEYKLQKQEFENEIKHWKSQYEKKIHHEAEQRVEESLRRINEIKRRCKDFEDMYIKLLYEQKQLKKDLEIKDSKIKYIEDDLKEALKVNDEDFDQKLLKEKKKVEQSFEKQIELKQKISDLQVEIEILSSQLQNKQQAGRKKLEEQNINLQAVIEQIRGEKELLQQQNTGIVNTNQRLQNSQREMEIIVQKFDYINEIQQEERVKDWIQDLRNQLKIDQANIDSD
ncbi:UNKNOWN [Stylonychia lemnae]|uniref:Uncharacterized protein n=1 Tax=Stylonychia lemnae TaxID=5949 RepID=A0A078AR01_STYLE|nr:UNKNOWN [Stylonychia lemnae]|eukprot:CDW84649.1 UNKNOWN [Stylonychia lemnae]